MKANKFIVHFFILAVFLISIAAASAAGLNDTADMDILNDGKNSFDSLYNEIKDKNSDFTFKSDYEFKNGSDESYSSGINVTKDNFVINGNNYKIDCKNLSRAFYITGKNVVINNLTIENAFYGYGSAIRTDSSLTLNNVNFINCFGDGKNSNYGAIYSSPNSVLNVGNCNFIDNGAEDGASITAINSTVNIVNSTFHSKSDRIVKGQIYLGSNSHATVVNSNFLNTTAKYASAIFLMGEGRLIIKNSKFKNLHANKTAGAIGAKVISELTISECEFDNVSSENNGGAVFADIFGDGPVFRSDVVINNTVFNNCYSGFGGAVLQLDGNLFINNTNFTSNRAEYEGGAVYTSHTNVEIYNSKFKSNTLIDDVSYGGACYIDSASAALSGNCFENNMASEGFAIYAYDNELTLNGNYFSNPSDGISICTVYGEVDFDDKNNFTTDVRSFNNTNDMYNFEGNANSFIIVNNTIQFNELPEKFDLRDYGWVTPVKNQGFMGSCWAFGNMAALESSLLRYVNRSYSLSVNNMQNSMLKYSKYGMDTLSEGGNPFTSIAYLIDWLGVFPDEYDGYDELGKISSLLITPEDIHIQNVAVVPPINATNRDLLKNALISYGAAAASHRAVFNESKYFNKTSSAQYCYNHTESTHRICVVGWDDSYSRYNFLKTPEGDGAWICKNSWGNGWGDDGYFYISYYDTSFGDKESVCYIINNDSYARIYQHDVGGDWKWVPEGKYYASVFTADADELISAVGTCFNQSGREYEFTISVNDVDVYTQKGVSKFYGYETVRLDKLIQIKKGDKFKVTFKNQLCVVHDLRIHPQYGNSFVSDNGKEWEDLAKVLFVAVLKTYTVSDMNITDNLVKYSGGDDQFVARVNPGDEVIFEINNKSYSVKADSNGLAKLDVNYSPGNYSVTTNYNNVSIVNYIIIKTTILSKDVEKIFKNDTQYYATFLDTDGSILKNTTVGLNINGVMYNRTTDDNGVARLNINLNPGNYTLTAINPISGEQKENNVTVLPSIIENYDITKFYKNGTQYVVKVLNPNGSAAGAGVNVTFNVNGVFYTRTTNASGHAKLNINLDPNEYIITAEHNGLKVSNKIKVLPVLSAEDLSMSYRDGSKFEAKLVDGHGNAYAGQTITFNINGVFYDRTTDANGIARLNINLMSGKYIITSMYSNGAAISNTITIT